MQTIFSFRNVRHNAAFAAGLALTSPVASLPAVPVTLAATACYSVAEIDAAFNRLAREIAKPETHSLDDDRWYVENVVARRHDGEAVSHVCPHCGDPVVMANVLCPGCDSELAYAEMADEEDGRHPLYESQGLTWN